MADAVNILLVDDEPGMLRYIRTLLEVDDYKVETASTGEEALQRVEKGLRPDLVLLDLLMPGIDGLQTLESIKRMKIDSVVVMISGHGTIETAVKATRLGAFDFVEKPLSIGKTVLVIKNALENKHLQEENRILKSELGARYRIVGNSVPMKALRQQLAIAAPTNGRVLIYGESGTGKELVARAIVSQGPRRGKPFISINCAALPENLIETELFGHEKGAFTDARTARPGHIELAHTGTLFLDEIATLGLALQSKLLRVLEDRAATRIGGNIPKKIDYRLITATNEELEDLVRAGRFREDLYYRINVIPIKLPPLRERTEDIPQLADFFLRRYNTRFRKRVQGVTDSTMTLLKKYWWPGNIRELENLIERLVAVSDKEYISEEDLPLEFHFAQLEPQGERSGSLFEDATNTFERNFILRALEKCGGNVTGTAEYLGIPLSTLKYKMDKLDVRQLAKRLRGA